MKVSPSTYLAANDRRQPRSCFRGDPEAVALARPQPVVGQIELVIDMSGRQFFAATAATAQDRAISELSDADVAEQATDRDMREVLIGHGLADVEARLVIDYAAPPVWQQPPPPPPPPFSGALVWGTGILRVPFIAGAAITAMPSIGVATFVGTAGGLSLLRMFSNAAAMAADTTHAWRRVAVNSLVPAGAAVLSAAVAVPLGGSLPVAAFVGHEATELLLSLANTLEPGAANAAVRGVARAANAIVVCIDDWANYR